MCPFARLCRPLASSLAPIVLIVAVFLSAPLAAQAEPGLQAKDRSDVAPAADPASALDIFIACRHARAADTITPLGQFCTLPLPSVRDRTRANLDKWLETAPPPPDTIRKFAEEVRQQQRARRAAAARASQTRGTDIGEGGVTFDDSDTLLAVTRDLLDGHVAAELRRMRDSLGVGRVYVVEHRAQRRSSKPRADAVLRHLELAVPGLRYESELHVDPGLTDRVTVLPVLPTIVATSVTVLAGVQFPEGENVVTDPFRVSQAAEQLISRSDYRNGAVVEVIGYPDPGNPGIAVERANALRQALIEADIPAHQITTRTSSTPRPATPAASPSQREFLTIPTTSGRASPLTSPTTSSAEFSLSWEAVAQAAAEALLERAEQEFQRYLLVTFSKRICDTEGVLLPQTCVGLAGLENGYTPALETLRAYVRRDVEQMPERAFGQLFVTKLPHYYANAQTSITKASQRIVLAQDSGADAVARARADSASAQAAAARVRWRAESAVIALFGLQVAQRVHRGEEPLDVLGGFPQWLHGLTADPRLEFVRAEPRIVTMERVADLLVATREAGEDLRAISGPNIPPDTVFRYAALQLSASLPEERRERLALSLANAADNLRRIESSLVAADSLRREITALQAKGDSTISARRAVYAQALGLLVRSATAGFNSRTNLSAPDTLAQLQATLTELLHAINTRSYPSLLQGSLTLLRELTPVEPQACDADACTAFVREQVRFLTLAVDVSEAQTQDDLRGAMARFVSGGGDAGAKRSSAQRGALYLNAYVGGGAALRDGASPDYSVRLPIGAEVVLRPHVTMFFQAIDLAGFLPQSGDASERTNDQRLSGVINPGLFAMVSLFDAPVSIGGGFTGSRVVEGGEWRSGLRWVFFAGVDLPLLRIH